MEGEVYYKSMVECPEGGLGTFSYDLSSGERRTCQTLKDILETETIVPNTFHSNFPRRLCVSRVSPRNTEVYRPTGIVFRAEMLPLFYVPFDLMALTNADSLSANSYDSEFLQGYQKFLFNNFSEMFSRYPDTKTAVEELNELRGKNDLPRINASKLKYNECCYLGSHPVDITPLALVGREEELGRLALKHNLGLFPNVKSYFKSVRRKDKSRRESVDYRKFESPKERKIWDAVSLAASVAVIVGASGLIGNSIGYKQGFSDSKSGIERPVVTEQEIFSFMPIK